MATVPVNITLGEALLVDVDALALREQRSRSNMINVLLREACWHRGIEPDAPAEEGYVRG